MVHGQDAARQQASTFIGLEGPAVKGRHFLRGALTQSPHAGRLRRALTQALTQGASEISLRYEALVAGTGRVRHSRPSGQTTKCRPGIVTSPVFQMLAGLRRVRRRRGGNGGTNVGENIGSALANRHTSPVAEVRTLLDVGSLRSAAVEREEDNESPAARGDSRKGGPARCSAERARQNWSQALGAVLRRESARASRRFLTDCAAIERHGPAPPLAAGPPPHGPITPAANWPADQGPKIPCQLQGEL